MTDIGSKTYEIIMRERSRQLWRIFDNVGYNISSFKRSEEEINNLKLTLSIPKVVDGKEFYFISNFDIEKVEKIEQALNKAGISRVWEIATRFGREGEKEVENSKALYLQENDKYRAGKIIDRIYKQYENKKD